LGGLTPVGELNNYTNPDKLDKVLSIRSLSEVEGTISEHFAPSTSLRDLLGEKQARTSSKLP